MKDNYLINSEIVNEIKEYIKNHKMEPFGAVLYNLGILNIITNVSDFYYEDSEEIKKRMKKVKEKGHI